MFGHVAPVTVGNALFNQIAPPNILSSQPRHMYGIEHTNFNKGNIKKYRLFQEYFNISHNENEILCTSQKHHHQSTFIMYNSHENTPAD